MIIPDIPARDRTTLKGHLKCSADVKDNVIKLLNSWEGRKSASKLREMLGQNKD